MGKIKKKQIHTLLSPSKLRGAPASHSVKIIHLDATYYFISSRVVMIDHTSAVNMHAKSGNLIDIMVYDGKTVAQVTIV